MKVPISWLKDFVEINLPLTDLAHQMTMAGLEVEEIHFVGLPLPGEEFHSTKITGIEMIGIVPLRDYSCVGFALGGEAVVDADQDHLTEAHVICQLQSYIGNSGALP